MGPPAVEVRFGDLVGRHQGDDALFSKRWRFELLRCGSRGQPDTICHHSVTRGGCPKRFAVPPPAAGLVPADATTDSYQAPENSAVFISQARSLRNEFALAIEHLPLAGEMEKAVASMQKVLDRRIAFRLAIVIAGILVADDRRTAIASTAGKRFASRSVRQATAGGRPSPTVAGERK